MRTVILIAALLASSAAYAAPADQELPIARQRSEIVPPPPSLQPKFREYVRERLPSLEDVVGKNFNPADAARQCASMAGESDYTLSLKNSSSGFSLACKIDIRKPE